MLLLTFLNHPNECVFLKPPNRSYPQLVKYKKLNSMGMGQNWTPLKRGCLIVKYIEIPQSAGPLSLRFSPITCVPLANPVPQQPASTMEISSGSSGDSLFSNFRPWLRPGFYIKKTLVLDGDAPTWVCLKRRYPPIFHEVQKCWKPFGY